MKLLRILTKLLLAIALLAFLLFSAATLRFIKAYYDETFRRSTLPGSTPYLLYSDRKSVV